MFHALSPGSSPGIRLSTALATSNMSLYVRFFRACEGIGQIKRVLDGVLQRPRSHSLM